MTLKILHFSDVHVMVPPTAVPPLSLAGKRALALANLVLRRGRRFLDVDRKLEALARFADDHAIDVAVCTGDYTAMGTEPEIVKARRAIEPLSRRPHGYLTLPGNHDIYLEDSVRGRFFEREFEAFLASDLPELAVDGPWPLVRFVEGVAFVLVNSARPNPSPLRSSGAISMRQLDVLPQIFAHPEVARRFVVVGTHYALRRADGTPDLHYHGLENADALLAACARLEHGAFLHGHIHQCFRLAVPGLAVPVFGAGSATDRGREGLWVLEVDGRDLVSARMGHWDGTSYQLR